MLSFDTLHNLYETKIYFTNTKCQKTENVYRIQIWFLGPIRHNYVAKIRKLSLLSGIVTRYRAK